MIYPIAIVLIVLGILNRFVNHAMYRTSIIFTAIFSIIDTVNITFLGKSLSDALSYIPLYDQGVGWVVPAIVGVVVGAIFGKGKSSEKVEMN